MSILNFRQFNPQFGTFLPLNGCFMKILCGQKACIIIHDLQYKFAGIYPSKFAIFFINWSGPPASTDKCLPGSWLKKKPPINVRSCFDQSSLSAVSEQSDPPIINWLLYQLKSHQLMSDLVLINLPSLL